MKVIDVLNKIANGENFDNCKMKFNFGEPELVNEYVIYADLYEEEFTLNDEVEIIEEPKEIEEPKNYEDFESIDDYIEHLRDKIVELIDVVKELKKENKQ